MQCEKEAMDSWPRPRCTVLPSCGGPGKLPDGADQTPDWDVTKEASILHHSRTTQGHQEGAYREPCIGSRMGPDSLEALSGAPRALLHGDENVCEKFDLYMMCLVTSV